MKMILIVSHVHWPQLEASFKALHLSEAKLLFTCIIIYSTQTRTHTHTRAYAHTDKRRWGGRRENSVAALQTRRDAGVPGEIRGWRNAEGPAAGFSSIILSSGSLPPAVDGIALLFVSFCECVSVRVRCVTDVSSVLIKRVLVFL